MPTKGSILRKIRRRHPRAVIDYRPNAPDAKRREANRKFNKERGAESQRLRAELKALKPKTRVAELYDAAKFVVDVDGDPIAVEKLRAAVERYSTVQNVESELQALRKERERPTTRKRYTVSIPKDIFNLILFDADSVAELDREADKYLSKKT